MYIAAMNPKVDFYFIKAKKWQQEVQKLRLIALDCQLTEELKMGRTLLRVPESQHRFDT